VPQDGHGVDDDPDDDNDRLANDLLRRPEEPRHSFREAPERVITEGTMVAPTQVCLSHRVKQRRSAGGRDASVN
jgi:hypothetical protein